MHTIKNQAMAKTEKQLLTVANYARLKNVTPQSVYQWIEAGRVKQVVIDGKKFIELKAD